MRKQNEETDAVQSRDRVTGETYVAEKAFATFCDSTPSNSGNHSHQTSHTTENDLKRCLKEEEITQKLQSAAKVINILEWCSLLLLSFWEVCWALFYSIPAPTPCCLTMTAIYLCHSIV